MGFAAIAPERRQVMTPEERKLVTELFDRLATLEDAERDPQAERLVRDGLRQAPNAPYALVQTVLVQDEALKRADARIRELESAVQPREQDTSFLGTMRDTLFGSERRGSVPTVRQGESEQRMSPAWHTGALPTGVQPTTPPAAGVPGAGGGSFLGTAAAAAAGVIGGSLLLDGIRSMMGHPSGAHAAFDPTGGSTSPWGGSAADSDLARQAGLDDIGRPTGTQYSTDRYGLVGDDTETVEDSEELDDLDDVDSGGDDLSEA
jgi:uncharacterized protein